MATCYHICIREQLDATWSEWFDNLTITHDDDGGTTLTGLVADQAALHGLLNKIRDLGLTLTAVAQFDAMNCQQSTPPSTQRRDFERPRSDL